MSSFHRSIYDLIQRESPGAPAGGPPPAPPGGPPPAPPAPPSPPAPAGTPPAPATGGEPDYKAMYETEKTAHEKTRHEAAGYRVGNKGQIADAIKTLGSALGVDSVTGDGQQPVTLESLAKMITEDRKKQAAENRALKIDNELKDLFVKHGVDAHTTRAVLIADGLLDDLDPSSAEFSKSLNAAVKDLAEKHPNLKVGQSGTPTPTRTSAPMKGNGGGVTQLSRADLQGMKPEEVNEAREKGQLDELLGRKPKP